MAAIKVRVEKDSWTQNEVGPITSALNTTIINHGMTSSIISWDGPTKLAFEIGKPNLTFANFQAFQTELAAGAAALGAKISLLDWLDD